MKRFTSGKLQTVNSAKPRSAICFTSGNLKTYTFNFCGDVHLYCLFFSMVFLIFPPGRLKYEIVHCALEDLKQYYGTILVRCCLLVALEKTVKRGPVVYKNFIL